MLCLEQPHTPLLQHNTQPVNFQEWLISLNVRHHPSGILSTLFMYALMWITNVITHTFIYSKPAFTFPHFPLSRLYEFFVQSCPKLPSFYSIFRWYPKNVKFGFTVQSRISQLIRYKHSEDFWNDRHQFSCTDCVYSVMCVNFINLYTVKWLTLWSKSKTFCPCNIIYITSRWFDMLTCQQTYWFIYYTKPI